MDVARVLMTREAARDLYQRYKAHRHYEKPIDWEIQRCYQLLAQGKLVIKAIESIKRAGLDEKGLPKLAITPATATHCHLRRVRNGSLIMCPAGDFWRERANQIRFAQETFTFPIDSFPLLTPLQPNERRWRQNTTDHKAITPIIPKHLRPRRGLASYHVLWEAVWEPLPPTDPFLLRRIGKADLWVICAHWDLTEVERAALSTRL